LPGGAAGSCPPTAGILERETIGDKKTALFLIMSDTDTTFNFILAMVQSQLINLLCDRAIPDGIKFQFVVLHQLPHLPDVKRR